MDVACHYCGGSYADPDAEAPDEYALRRHLLVECTEVPAPIRQQYDHPCASGRCRF